MDYFLSPDYDGTPIETPKQLDISLLIYLSLAWFPISFILRVIGRWGIFRKSGKKGWLSLIPFFSVYQEYSLAWMGWIGILVSLFMLLPVFNVWLNVNVYYLYALCAVAFIVTVPESILLAKMFGKKTVIGALLAVPVVHEIGRIVLGFGKAEYQRSDRI